MGIAQMLFTGAVPRTRLLLGSAAVASGNFALVVTDADGAVIDGSTTYQHLWASKVPASATLTVAVTNTGDVPVAGLSLVDGVGGTTLTTSCGDTLAPGESCAFILHYPASGQNYEGNVTVSGTNADAVVFDGTAAFDYSPE